MNDLNDLVDLTLHLAAERLRLLHVAGDPIVLVNVWDARRHRGAHQLTA